MVNISRVRWVDNRRSTSDIDIEGVADDARLTGIVDVSREERSLY